MADADRGVDEVEGVDAVDHDRDRGQPTLPGAQLLQRGPVGRRVGEQDVVDALIGEPVGLGERVAHDAGESLPAERALDDVADPHGLAGHTDGNPVGAPDQVVGIGPQGGLVDDGDGAVEIRDGTVEAIEGFAHAASMPFSQIVGQSSWASVPVCSKVTRVAAR